MRGRFSFFHVLRLSPVHGFGRAFGQGNTDAPDYADGHRSDSGSAGEVAVGSRSGDRRSGRAVGEHVPEPSHYRWQQANAFVAIYTFLAIHCVQLTVDGGDAYSFISGQRRNVNIDP